MPAGSVLYGEKGLTNSNKGLKHICMKDTLKRKRLIKHIPTSSTLKEASIKAGYSSNSRAIYTDSMREYIIGTLEKQGYSEDALLREFETLSSECKIKGDYSTCMRGIENIAKMQGYFSDKTSNNIALFNLSQQDSDTLRAKLHNKEVLSINNIEDAAAKPPIKEVLNTNIIEAVETEPQAIEAVDAQAIDSDQ